MIPDSDYFKQARKKMVKEQIRKRGVKDPRVLDALLTVPRHLFVEKSLQKEAYEDRPQPIAEEQTISQPYIVAAMTEWLNPFPESRVLEIGTGSGYQAAVLALLAREVYTVERHRALHLEAAERLKRLNFHQVICVLSDGSLGYEAAAPYDGILVTAGAPHIPEALLNQLNDGGVLVAPVGDRRHQRLIRITRLGDEFVREEGTPCRFVPLIGNQGWPEK
ncbi:MAG: protein-L-isoaspartate(D-aspartate) O-methyltransferase [Candidatus Hydrogenedens sp.]|jgi:protein-L-isoaspartate(D-aspartate) O-methyltransferase|nr:protein-L-isoaspartate(D-aspartate) O-methyltransferase [Candidatus Hydrogenedens sp.]